MQISSQSFRQHGSPNHSRGRYNVSSVIKPCYTCLAVQNPDRLAELQLTSLDIIVLLRFSAHGVATKVYLNISHDPLMRGASSGASNYLWFRWFLAHEFLFFLPTYFLGIRGLIRREHGSLCPPGEKSLSNKNENRRRLKLLLHSSHLIR